jgi:hypothetical protein
MPFDMHHIRTCYPHPIRLQDAANYVEAKRYCVGGAVCKFLDLIGNANGFPDTSQLTRALRVANKQLPYRKARYYAETIIRRNDSGQFTAAWFYVARALDYQPEEK